MDSEDDSKDVKQPEVYEIYEKLAEKFKLTPLQIRIITNSMYKEVARIIRDTVPEDESTHAHIKITGVGVFTISKTKTKTKLKKAKEKHEKNNNSNKQNTQSTGKSGSITE